MLPHEVLAAIRARRPLVHCLSNAVTLGRVADALAAVGALPVMAGAVEEAADMAEQAQALVLNLGTPTADRFRAAEAAAEQARACGVPIVLDPVGCGATPWRTDQIRQLALAIRPEVVRGNAAEVATLAGVRSAATLRGVSLDRGHAEGTSSLAVEAARILGGVVVVTGARDAASDGRRRLEYATGVPMLAGVVGAGDVLTALVGACCAVDEDCLDAASSALTLFGAAARIAARDSAGPGTFWVRLVDALANLSDEDLADRPVEILAESQ